jgi:hypothetical protein
MHHVSSEVYEVADTSLVPFYSILALVCAAVATDAQSLQPVICTQYTSHECTEVPLQGLVRLSSQD